MRKFVLFLALGASGFAGAASSAQTAPQPTAPAPRPMPPHGGPMMRADADGDGKVSRAEFIAQADGRFLQMDTDKDGTVSRSEMKAFRQAMHDRRIADGARGDMPPPRPHDGKRPKPPKDHGEHGPDGEFKDKPPITRQAFTDRAAKRFDRIDANRDGVIDQTEIAAARPMRGRHGKHGGPGHDMPPPPPPAAPAPGAE